MAGEEKKKQSVPDEVNGDGYDDTKNTSTGVGAGVNGYDSVYGTGSVVFPEVGQGNNAYQQWLKNQGLILRALISRKFSKHNRLMHSLSRRIERHMNASWALMVQTPKDLPNQGLRVVDIVTISRVRHIPHSKRGTPKRGRRSR